MKLLLICRDAVENSIISNLLLAMDAKKMGDDANILFTQEALAALAGESLDWSPLLRNRDTRTKVAKKAAEQELPTYPAPTRGFPAVNTMELIKKAKAAGVSLCACPLWVNFLELQGKLPEEITELDSSALWKMIKEAETIIGNF